MRSKLAAASPTHSRLEIRHTFASVLREYARIACDKRKEDEILRRVIEGGSNPLMILKLEEQRRHEERLQDTKRTQEKRLNALLSREDAFLAKQLSLRDVKLQAETMRKEKRQLYKELDELRQNRSREMAKIIEECHATKRATHEAFRSMVEQKRRRAAEISEESRQLRLTVVKQKEEDARKKAHLIREMKATRTTPIRDCDLVTGSSGMGFLGEVSMTELREKMRSTKVRLKEEIERRNSVIRQERERRKNLMRSNQRLLDRHKVGRQAICSMSDSSVVTRVTDFPELEQLRKLLKERKTRRYEEQKRLLV